jgi:hypothetical protein
VAGGCYAMRKNGSGYKNQNEGSGDFTQQV